MSAYDGGLKRSTQHVMSDARDGVDGRWVEDMFEGSTRWPRRSCGTAGGARSQFNRVARQLNERSRETLGFETRAERDLTLVLHRPIELTTKTDLPVSDWTPNLFGPFAAAISPATKSSLSAACCTTAATILQKVVSILRPVVAGDFLAWLDLA